MTRIEYKWSDQKYIYITNREVDNLLFDQNVTLSKWQEFTSSLNNVISFSNYIDLILPSRINSEINNSEIEHEYIVPSGLFATCALLTTRQTMNPIYNTKLNAFGELRVYYNIEDSIDYQNTKRRINISQVNDLNVNVLYSDIKTNQNVYTFFSDKTNEFYTNHTTLLSKLNVRNTLNDIKKTIKLSSYSALFSNIKSIKDITNQIKIIYSNAMSSYLRRRLISNFKIQLDEKSTSKEDIAEGIVRGAIYIQFPNQETTNINI